MSIYEGKWRCTFCRTVCRGRDMSCTGCAAPRGADVEFFLDEDAQPLTDGALLREAVDGPDWLCETCGGSNRFNVKTCQTCGAPLGGSIFRRVTESYSDGVRGADGTAGKQRAPGWPPSFILLAITGVGLIVLFALLSIGASVDGGSALKAFESTVDPRSSISRKIELAVERVEWKRSVVIEEYRDVVSEDWEGSVPSDAQVISRRQEIHHQDRVRIGSHIVQEHYTERVRVGSRTVTETYTDREYGGTERYQCGTRNRGNGYFETVYCTRPVYRTVTKTRSKQVDDYQNVPRVRDKTVEDYQDVPVYRAKIRYSAKRWVAAETLATQGTDSTPRWPEFVGGATKRAGERRESFRVFLRDLPTNKVYEREVGAEEFTLFNAGAKCAATVNGFDQIVSLTPPTTDASR